MIYGPLLFAFVLGYLILATALREADLPHKALFIWIMSAPVGLACCSLIIFWSYLIAPPAQAKLFTFLFGYLLLGDRLIQYLTKQNVPASPMNLFSGWRSWFVSLGTRLKNLGDFNMGRSKTVNSIFTIAAFGLFVFALHRFINVFISISTWDPIGGWDARFFWNVKAKFFFRSPADWTAMFSPLTDWSHPDYPLLLPGSVAWGWNWIGREVLLWPCIVAFIFSLSLILLLFWYLLSYASPAAACLGAAFLTVMEVYEFWSTTQYADVPLCLFMTGGAFLTLAACRLRQAPLFFMAGLIAALGAWTKNEGLFYFAWAALLLCLALLLDKGSDFPAKKKFVVQFALGAAAPLATIICLKGFLARSGDYLGSHRTIQDYAGMLFGNPAKTEFIAKSFFSFMFVPPHWNGLWVLFFLAAGAGIAFKFREWKVNYGWFLFSLAVLIEFGYFAVIHVSPHEVRWQIETALTRLLLHSSVLAVAFVFETFSPAQNPE